MADVEERTTGDREERRRALAEAKQKLESRRKARQDLKNAREQRQRTQGNANNFGRQYVENFLKIIKDTEVPKKGATQESKTDGTGAGQAGAGQQQGSLISGGQTIRSSKYRAPGRRRVLESSDKTVFLYKDERKVETYDKEIETDTNVFVNYLINTLEGDFDEKTFEDKKDKEKIYAEFIRSEESNCWPVTSRRARSVSIGAGLLPPGPDEIGDIADWEMAYGMEDENKEEELMLLAYEDANHLINSGNFLDSFRLKSKWMERALGINEEIANSSTLLKYEDISFDMTENVVKGGADEIRTQLKRAESSKSTKRELLTLKKQFIHDRYEGRPIGWIEFSNINPDWFLATYSRRGRDDAFSTEPEGLINIWNFVIPRNPEYTLFADSMVSAARFHPTHNSIIFGSTLSGQVLQWDIRTNNYSKPVSRTNFAHGHSSPVFGLSFLPSMNAKNQHFVSVSNDGKVCMWKDNDLSESTSEIILKVDDADKQALLSMSGSGLGSSATTTSSRTMELGTTCFSYSVKEWNTMTFGSDEGNIYKAEIHGGGKANDDVTNNKKSSKKNSSKGGVGGSSNISGVLNNNSSNKPGKPGASGGSSGASGAAAVEVEYVNVLEMIDKAHEGPITNISYNPCQPHQANTIQKQQLYNENISTLYLTSSYDWTVKLWHSKYHQRGAISTFDTMTDYVYDVKWSNIKPSVFACGDGDGKINLFNLNDDFNAPIGNVIVPKERIKNLQKYNMELSQSYNNNNKNNKEQQTHNLGDVHKAVTKLEFTKNGKYLMAGDSEGMIHMYSLHKNLYANGHDEYDTLADKVQRKVKDFVEKE